MQALNSHHARIRYFPPAIYLHQTGTFAVKKHTILVLLCGWQLIAHAQQQDRSLLVSRTDSAVNLDGELSESIWRRAAVATGFQLNFPNDVDLARNQTQVRLTFDAQYLYIAAVCLDQDRDRRFVASSLRRDFDWGENDNFTIYMDPFGDGQNGFTFNATPLGVEREGLIFNGERVSSAWDNKWRSKVKVYADRWVAEIAIPFKTIRYKGSTQRFKMNFARHDLKNNQRSSWSPVPIAYNISSLAYTGTVDFEEPLPRPGVNIAVIPYVTGGANNRFFTENDSLGFVALNEPTKTTANAGFDAKIAVSSSLNLDVTVNPDFSQVEVDQQVTNLNRFEIFFPERRLFFLENADLFDSFGFEQNKPFFSRRIGIGRDRVSGQIVQNPILYGARLSGKIDKHWRIGLLNMQTARDAGRGIGAQNYTVAAVQRSVFARSNIAAIVMNRSRAGSTDAATKYTRLAGLEYNLLSADNKWTGKVFYHQALQPGGAAGNYTHGSRLKYQDRNWNIGWLHEFVGDNYNINDIGYVARARHWQLNPELNYRWYPENNRNVVAHGPGVELKWFSNLKGRTLDRNLDLFYNIQGRNTSKITAGLYQYYTYLFFGFDPTNSGGGQLPQNTGYNQTGVFLEYVSDARKLFNWSVSGFAGGYYNGNIVSVTSQINYRFQPYGSVGLNIEHNRLRLPETYADADFWLIGPRVDVSFTRKVFLTTFLQYNQQNNNVNINSRLQWRFKPVSDLFIVYTDNYFADNTFAGTSSRFNFNVGAPKNRALVLKLTYWLNV